MSMNPNNPFDRQQGDPDFGHSPPPSKSGKGCLIGCLGVGFLAVFVCCGGTVAVMYFALSVLSDEYKRQLTGNPVIEEHIGNIESMEFSWSATVEENSGNQGGGAQIGFEIQGSKGSGRVLIEQDQGAGNMIKSAILVLPDGTRIPIDLSGSPDSIDALDESDPMPDPFDSTPALDPSPQPATNP